MSFNSPPLIFSVGVSQPTRRGLGADGTRMYLPQPMNKSAEKPVAKSLP
jgi:hypothetical protein